jgi:tRNA modification GTPase
VGTLRFAHPTDLGYILRMTAPERDTIFALSSGRPPAAIAVIRISGPRARVALEAMLGRVPEPRKAALARLKHPATGELVDEALALWFPGPASETGEDTAELQVHGGRAVIAAVLGALGQLDGFRMAAPGEFTRRAFENGRIDLTQIEALADLVAAETEAQRRQAFHQLRGLLGNRAEAWRATVIEALALVEAGIDFSDEGDVPKDLLAEALAIVRPLAQELSQVPGTGRGERLREGLWVAIAGPPNAGKSTLLNRLARREAAIVAPTAGTTRDVIEVHLDLGGYPFNLLDTAGFNEKSDDPIEREGMRRAMEVAARADLVLWVVDPRATDALAPSTVDQEPSFSPYVTRWLVANKIDLLDGEAKAKFATTVGRWPVHHIAAATGEGVDALVAAIVDFAGQMFPPEPALVTRERQRAHIQDATFALVGACQRIEEGAGEELVAEALRQALVALGKLTGRVDVEEILDVIFRDFCIGK